MVSIALKVNGNAGTADVEARMLLVEFLLAHTRSALVPSQAFRAQGLRISVGLDDGQPPIFGSPPLRSGGIGVLTR